MTRSFFSLLMTICLAVGGSLATGSAASADGIDEIFVKLDAETGFALGGNKVRKLEYELSPERLEGIE